MKTLLLMRHAKSDWSDDSLDDHERPLNSRGKKDAPCMGRLLLEEGLLPDLILASDAKRSIRTVEKVVEASGYGGTIILMRALYQARPSDLVKVISQLGQEPKTLLVIGHNPGLEECLEGFIRQYEPLSTAALAHLQFPTLKKFEQLKPDSKAKLVRLWQPPDVA